MDIFSPDALRNLALFLPVLIISLSIHEFAHAWSAMKLGDATAKYLGRLTLDPMAHISVLGTIVFPAISLLTGTPLFGWANPVPVDSRNFKKPRSDMAIVSFAGPASNIAIAVVCTAILSVVVHSGGVFPTTQSNLGVKSAAMTMLAMAVRVNLFLAYFNMLPIPPLDGAKVLQAFLSHKNAQKIDQYAPQGQLIILLLFITGLFSFLAWPVSFAFRGLFALFQIPF